MRPRLLSKMLTLLWIPMFGYSHNLLRLNTTRQRLKRYTRIWRVFTVISPSKSRENSKRGKKRKNWKKQNRINPRHTNFHSNFLLNQRNQRKLKSLRSQMQMSWELRKMRKRDQRLWELIQFYRMLSTPLRRTKLIKRSTRRSIILSQCKKSMRLRLSMRLKLSMWNKNKNKKLSLCLCQKNNQLKARLQSGKVKTKVLHKMLPRKLNLYRKLNLNKSSELN